MRNIGLVITLAISVLLAFPAKGQDRPELVSDTFAAAWNAHDIEEFGTIFAEDADWVTVAGVKVKGRSGIQSVLSKEHSTWAKTTTMSVTALSVRRVDRKNFVVYFGWTVSGIVGRDGKAISDAHGVSMLVVSRRLGGWQVVAGQAARTPSGG